MSFERQKFKSHPDLQQNESVESEEGLFEERARFIRENYPGGKAKHDDIIRSALEGNDVIEEREADGSLNGLITYIIAPDNHKDLYCSIGVVVVREELRGETDIAKNLLTKVLSKAQQADCNYCVAIADTPQGKNFLERNGFTEEIDKINKREYWRLEL